MTTEPMSEWGELGADYGRDIDVQAKLHWAGDFGDDFASDAMALGFGDDAFAMSDIDQFLGWGGDDEYYGEDDDEYYGDEYGFLGLGKALKKAAGVVKTVAKPVAIVSGIAAAGTAVVFPPAAPVFGTLAVQAAAAATIASGLDAVIPSSKRVKRPNTASGQRRLAYIAAMRARRAKAQRMVAATKAVAVSSKANKNQRKAAQRALRGIKAALAARRKARRSKKRVAFVVSRKGFVARVK